MRYGKPGHLEIDPEARRQPGQSLKKAAKGAPFGWTSDGRPYGGTKYGVSADGRTFYSISTRDGGEQRYAKPLREVSARVATSALETHGAVRRLVGMAAAPPEVCKAVEAAFVGKVGRDFMESISTVTDAAARASKRRKKSDPEAAEAAPSADPVALEAADAAARSARMLLVDAARESAAAAPSRPAVGVRRFEAARSGRGACAVCEAKIALGAAKCQLVGGAFCHPTCCAASLAAIARLDDVAGWATLTADAKQQVRAAAASIAEGVGVSARADDDDEDEPEFVAMEGDAVDRAHALARERGEEIEL